MDQILHRDVGFRGAICRGGGQGPGSYCTKVILSPFSLLFYLVSIDVLTLVSPNPLEPSYTENRDLGSSLVAAGLARMRAGLQVLP